MTRVTDLRDRKTHTTTSHVFTEPPRCHDCKHDKQLAKLAEEFDTICPLEINEKATCDRCHEQRGIWWFIPLLRG